MLFRGGATARAIVSATTLANLTQLSNLINLIYEGATDPARWDGILPAIAEWLDAPRGWLVTPLHVPESGGFVFTHGLAPTMLQTWRDRYHAEDLWAIRGAEQGKFVDGNVVTGDELVAESELTATAIYRDFMVRHKIHHLLSGVVFGISDAGILPTVCAFFRGADADAFAVEHKSKMGLLVPHISRALGVMQRLRDADLKFAASLAALDKLSAGVLLLARNQSVVFANRAARRVLQREDGLRLRLEPTGQTVLSATASDTQRAINTAIRQCVEPHVVAVSHFSKAVRVDRASGLIAYTLNFSALPEQNEFGGGAARPCAIAFLNDPDEPVQVDLDILRRLYGLTAAECRLASRLCDGHTLSAIAAQLRVSENTVKTQLRSIFGKTKTRRQAELVRLLVSLDISRA